MIPGQIPDKGDKGCSESPLLLTFARNLNFQWRRAGVPDLVNTRGRWNPGLFHPRDQDILPAKRDSKCEYSGVPRKVNKSGKSGIFWVFSRARKESTGVQASSATFRSKPVYDPGYPFAIQLLSVLHPGEQE